MSNITVYTKPNCVKCTATKRALMKAGLPFEEVNLMEDVQALETVKSLGYVEAPIVMVAEDHWSGYRPDRIKKIQSLVQA